MTPSVVGHTNDGRPVYDMAGGADGLTLDDLVRGELVVVSIGEWADAMGLTRERAARRLQDGRPLHRVIGDELYQREWDNGLPYMRDADARRFVRAHPDGATLDEVGALWGLTKEAVRLLEFQALEQLRAGLDPAMRAFVLAWLNERHERV